MKNRFLSLTLILALIVTLLSACGNTAAPTEPSATEEQPTSAATVQQEVAVETTEPSTEPPTEPEPTWDDSLFTAPETEPEQPDLENPVGLSVKGCSKTAESDICVVIGSSDLGVTVQATNDDGEVLSSCQAHHGWFTLRLPNDYGETVTLKEYYQEQQVSDELPYTLYPVSPSGGDWGVIAGYDGQLFLEKAAADYDGSNRLSEEELAAVEETTKSHVETAKQLGKNGCEIIYIVVPSAMSVYPDRVPETIQPSEATKYQQMLTAFRDAGATVIDLLPVFQAHKSDALPLYARFDSHFTEYGGYLVYTELFKYVSQTYPEAAPKTFNQFSWDGDDYESGDTVYYLGQDCYAIDEYLYLRTPLFPLKGEAAEIQRFFKSTSLSYDSATDMVKDQRTITTGNTELPNILIYRDSFSTYYYDILADNCNVSTWMPMWNFSWNTAQLAESAPDYIVYILTEWNLESLR